MIEIYKKIRSCSDDELCEILKEFYEWSYTDGYNGNDYDWSGTLQYTMTELNK